MCSGASIWPVVYGYSTMHSCCITISTAPFVQSFPMRICSTLVMELFMVHENAIANEGNLSVAPQGACCLTISSTTPKFLYSNSTCSLSKLLSHKKYIPFDYTSDLMRRSKVSFITSQEVLTQAVSAITILNL